MTTRSSAASAATPAPLRVARFEAARLPDGWSVVDLLRKTALAPARPWDEATATMAASALNTVPAYATLFRWSEPESYPVQRWDVLTAPVRAQTPDGSAVADLLASTTFDAFTGPDAAGRVQIAAFAPGDADGESCRLWLVDERELWAAAAAMAGGGETA